MTKPVFLPQTSFSMRGNLSQKEPQILEIWEKINLYQKIQEKKKGKPTFILPWGPPYANGSIHIGHALSETLKDILVKTYVLKGYQAPLIPGWDCHGLPIEWKIEEKYRSQNKNKDDVPVEDFLKECRTFAGQWIDTQKTEFKRLGILADYDNPYITMDSVYEAEVMKQAYTLLNKGLLVKGQKPVLWSVIEKTALAEAEVEYNEAHQSDAVYVAFPIQESKDPDFKGASVVIWTTTPWTLPANRAVAYGADYTYVLLESNGKRLIFAKDRVEALSFLESVKILKEFPGTDLEGTFYSHPLFNQGFEFTSPLLPGHHVTTDAGTGLVHIAPTHGLEDFEIGQKYNLEIPELVQVDGTYAPHVPFVAGLHIYKVASKIIEGLRENLLFHEKITHSYPYSWRSKTPLIYRTTTQWFIRLDPIKPSALQAIGQVKWFPAQGKQRIKSMVENRSEWCLSRQRLWGVPLGLFLHKETKQPLIDLKAQERALGIIREEGIEGWHRHDVSFFLDGIVDPNLYEKCLDTVDVWFDSGCVYQFLSEHRSEAFQVADVYLEGSDQHRGWFQSSLLNSCATAGQAPYRNVVTHGFVLDEKGRKMSKSVGNVVAPQEINDRLGADLLRLWVITCDYSDDVRIGQEILKHQEDLYRRFRNTLRYLLGALSDRKPQETVGYDQLPELEKWILHRLWEISQLHQKCLEEFDLSRFYMALHAFCNNDLSALYFDIRKDALYCDADDSLVRRSCLTVMDHILNHIMFWLAPVLSFTAEEAYQTYSQPNKKESIFLEELPGTPSLWENSDLSKTWEELLEYRSLILQALEKARAQKIIGSSLQAHVEFTVPKEKKTFLGNYDWAEITIASEVSLTEGELNVKVSPSTHSKCPRCWKYLAEVEEKGSCVRCERVH